MKKTKITLNREGQKEISIDIQSLIESESNKIRNASDHYHMEYHYDYAMSITTFFTIYNIITYDEEQELTKKINNAHNEYYEKAKKELADLHKKLF